MLMTTTNKKTSKKQSPRNPTTTDVEIGKRIRIRRNELKISQSELGEKLGVSFQQVQKIETGVNRVGAARLQRVATILDVPITFFYRGDVKEQEVTSLLYLDSKFSVRLLRAYNGIKNQAVQRKIVALMEAIAGSESLDI